MDVAELINESSTNFSGFTSWIDILLDWIRKMSRSLSFTMQLQTQSQWCWAATSTSTSHFYNAGSTWTQCTVANATLGETTCCSSPSSSACNKPWFLDQALTTTHNFDHFVGGQITMAQVKAEIDAGRPVGARIGWSGGGGHFMVISGYSTLSNTLTIRDPIYGTSTIAFSTFQSSYQGSGKWTHTYYTRA